MNPYAEISIGKIQRILANDTNYENISDLIADIMHYCDHSEIPFEAALNKAQGYYEADLEESLLEDDGA